MKFKKEKVNIQKYFTPGTGTSTDGKTVRTTVGQMPAAMKGSKDASTMDTVAAKYRVTRKELIGHANVAVMTIADNESVAAKVARLRKDPSVESAQPNYKYTPLAVNPSDDTDYGKQWGLHNTGQSFPVDSRDGSVTTTTYTGTADADVDAPEAWALSDGSSHQAVVAVIDTGVAYNHPDLVPNMWDGSSCVDEDGIAIVGGCPHHGWDFDYDVVTKIDGDNDPSPGHHTTGVFGGIFYSYSSHGTHVAGIVAGADNSGGIVGIAPHAKIMALKTADLTTDEIVRAIAFAENNGAKVINASWGGGWSDTLLRDAIAGFDGLFVAAAGNEYGPAIYPCLEDLDNILCVAASDKDDALADFSSYDATGVDVAAPGALIVSSVGDSDFAYNDFETMTPPNLPMDLTRSAGSAWQSRDVTSVMVNAMENFGSAWGKVAYGDNFGPYADNADTTLMSDTFDLSDTKIADFWFMTACNTTPDDVNWHDYMALEVSGDNGATWSEISRWDESALGGATKDGYATGRFLVDELDHSFYTAAFKYRFRWVTDGTDNNYDGCLIDGLWSTRYTKGAPGMLEYYSGTSMATPMTAGLAALLWGTDNTLTAAQVKDVIMYTGDKKSVYEDKTVSQRRINAHSALTKLADTTAPAVTAPLGSGTADPVIAANETGTITFNEAISAVGRAAVEAALDAALPDGTRSDDDSGVTYGWDADGVTLTITAGSDGATFADDVTADVTDIVGNTANALIIVNASDDVTPPAVVGVEDGTTYTAPVTPTFDEGTATLNGAPFTSGTHVADSGTYELVVTDAAGNETRVSFTVELVLEVTSVTVSELTKSSVRISWTTSTDAAGVVRYGTDKKKLSASVTSTADGTEHSVVLSSLKKNKKYYFRVDASADDLRDSSNLGWFKTKKK